VGTGEEIGNAENGIGNILRCDDPGIEPWKECVYVEYAPISDLAGDGHNYFRSKNEIATRSWAVFGEAYWDLRPNLRLTAGLRYTDDRKITTPYPSQLLLGSQVNGTPGPSSGGYVSRGYPALDDIKQHWGATTGRLVLDWTPDLAFTDETLLYASLSRGYKGGGTNPPRIDLNPGVVEYLPLAEDFEPEYVNAFEIGAKNVLMDGQLTLNATGFFYDYKDYQVSQISLNENFDARIWGVELETIWRPTEAFRMDANLGYLNTRIADGEGSIDVMDRTQGNEDWMVLRPWIQVPSNCVAPTKYVEQILNSPFDDGLKFLGLAGLCAGSSRFGSFNPDFNTILPLWQFFGFTYNPLVEAPNAGRGFNADLSGNELPNAPNWTVNFGAQHTFFLGDWDLTVRGDYYWQDASFARVYNTEYDRLEAWDNANLSVTLERPDSGLVFKAYVKNLFDETPITDAFTNSDDTGLTTNVFTLDPRLFALSISKRF
jgi:outer membrane receptor protein involved in Fe transport